MFPVEPGKANPQFFAATVRYRPIPHRMGNL
jgi:hypothetical protein